MQPGKANGSNGSNGSNGHGKHAEGIVLFSDQRDDGARDIPPPLCAKRLEHGGWCVLPDKHDGECSGIAMHYGPVVTIWEQHKGKTQLCGKVTTDPKICLLPRGHGGKCQ